MKSLARLKDARLEIVITPKEDIGPWAYFSVYARRRVAKRYHTKAATRVLLVLSIPVLKGRDYSDIIACLRDAFGHALLYLRSPKAWNDCDAAMAEWRSCAPSSGISTGTSEQSRSNHIRIRCGAAIPRIASTLVRGMRLAYTTGIRLSWR